MRRRLLDNTAAAVGREAASRAAREPRRAPREPRRLGHLGRVVSAGRPAAEPADVAAAEPAVTTPRRLLARLPDGGPRAKQGGGGERGGAAELDPDVEGRYRRARAPAGGGDEGGGPIAARGQAQAGRPTSAAFSMASRPTTPRDAEDGEHGGGGEEEDSIWNSGAVDVSSPRVPSPGGRAHGSLR